MYRTSPRHPLIAALFGAALAIALPLSATASSVPLDPDAADATTVLGELPLNAHGPRVTRALDRLDVGNSEQRSHVLESQAWDDQQHPDAVLMLRLKQF